MQAYLKMRSNSDVMLFDSSEGGGEGPSGPECPSCRRPINDSDASERITFPHDPHGHRGLSGLYHVGCAKPFASLARIMNLKPWA